MKLKKLLSVLLLCGMLLCILPLSAQAETLSVSLTAQVTAYDTVAVTIRSDGGYLTSGRLFLDYDGDVLEYVSYEALDKNDLMYAAPLATGTQAVIYYACSKTVHNAAFGKVFFRIKHYDKKSVSFGLTATYLYGGTTADCDVASLVSAEYIGTSVNLPAVTYIYARPVKSNFAVGEIKEYLPSYLEVTATFEGGETAVVPSAYVKVAGTFDGNTPSIYHLKCTYGGQTAQFAVQVYEKEKDVASLTVKQLPAQTEFTQGEETVFSGLRIYADYTDGTGEMLDRTKLVIKGFNPEKCGEQVITVGYCNAETTFTVTVTPRFIKGDTDGDGNVTVSDARLALRAAVKLEDWGADTTKREYLASDVDGAEGISVADARLILRVAVKLESF